MEKPARVKRRISIQDVAQAAAGAGLDEEATRKLLAQAEDKQNNQKPEDDEESDEVEDHFADYVPHERMKRAEQRMDAFDRRLSRAE